MFLYYLAGCIHWPAALSPCAPQQVFPPVPPLLVGCSCRLDPASLNSLAGFSCHLVSQTYEPALVCSFWQVPSSPTGLMSLWQPHSLQKCRSPPLGLKLFWALYSFLIQSPSALELALLLHVLLAGGLNLFWPFRRLATSSKLTTFYIKFSCSIYL